MTRLPVAFTETFAVSYRLLPDADVEAVNQMLDRLEVRHGKPEMRSRIRVGSTSLFATPRIYTAIGVYRITWRYDDGVRPALIACVTVASVET